LSAGRWARIRMALTNANDVLWGFGYRQKQKEDEGGRGGACGSRNPSLYVIQGGYRHGKGGKKGGRRELAQERRDKGRAREGEWRLMDECDPPGERVLSGPNFL